MSPPPRSSKPQIQVCGAVGDPPDRPAGTDVCRSGGVFRTGGFFPFPRRPPALCRIFPVCCCSSALPDLSCLKAKSWLPSVGMPGHLAISHKDHVGRMLGVGEMAASGDRSPCVCDEIQGTNPKRGCHVEHATQAGSRSPAARADHLRRGDQRGDAEGRAAVRRRRPGRPVRPAGHAACARSRTARPSTSTATTSTTCWPRRRRALAMKVAEQADRRGHQAGRRAELQAHGRFRARAGRRAGRPAARSCWRCGSG